MRPLPLHAAGLAAAALLATAPAVSAQPVTGRVVDRSNGQPASSVLVLLLREDGRAESSWITDASGAFRLDAPREGAWTVRAEALGFGTAEVTVEVREEEGAHGVEVLLGPRPIELRGLEARSTRRCADAPAGREVAELWSEARRIFADVRAGPGTTSLVSRIVSYRKTWDADMEEERAYEADTILVEGVVPMGALEPELLARDGFVVQVDDTVTDYYGPEASTLLSDPFLTAHCFEVRGDEARPAWLGLAFRPLESKDRYDIRGTFWMPLGATARPYVEFEYAPQPFRDGDVRFGGRVELGYLDKVGWLVRSWHIRTPVLQRRRRRGVRLVEVREMGAWLDAVAFQEGGR